jgi:hypothetical protein
MKIHVPLVVTLAVAAGLVWYLFLRHKNGMATSASAGAAA